MKIFRYLIIILIFFVFSCDGLSDPKDVDDHEIESMLTDLEIAFNSNSLSEIMDSFSTSFLHNGDRLHQIEILWQVRLNDYENLQLNDIKIDYIDDYKAILNMTIKFDNETYDSPEELSDFSYLYREISGWKIYGNQVSR